MTHDNVASGIQGHAPRPSMTVDERVEAVMTLGFTARQAAFLTAVMLHAGVCLPRQYTAFCRIVFGHTTRDFFARLVRERFARSYPCWRRGGTIYHVHHKGLYRAIGEPDDRHRRRVTTSQAVKRLMLLDVVFGEPDLKWLATEREKVAHFAARNVDPTVLPAHALKHGRSRVVHHFPDKLPIGIRAASDEPVLVYLVASPNNLEVQRFLIRHRALFGELPRFTIRLVFPRVVAAGQTAVERFVSTFFSDPPIRVVVLEEFRRYCRARRTIELSGVPEVDPQRYAIQQRAFAAPRFAATYRAWVTQGESAFHHLVSSHFHEAWQRGEIRIERTVLPSRYLHLEEAIGTA